MRFIKRMLLFAAVGSVSLVLAGCYGAPVDYRDESFTPPSDVGDDAEPVEDLETTADEAP